ncbi:MAG: hypothetical protein HY873_09135 [Chloroflexi bacterium]|nr:hypothetical protein [Chloroflexota bacterium]
MDEGLIARADANYFGAWAAIVATMPEGETRERAGVLITCSGLPVTIFNIAFVTRPLADPDAALRDAAAFFDERKLPFVVRVREGVDPASEAAAERMGMVAGGLLPSMILSPMKEPPPVPAGLEIRTAADIAGLRDHAAVVADAFGFPLQLAEQVLTERLLTLTDTELYVGYVDGRPVASSAMFAVHRTAGVYNVGCVGTHRRKGYGEAMTWHAVRCGGSMGCIMSSLQASEMGAPVYTRMGYETPAHYKTFHRPGSE